jgi:hypothetical protein
MLRDYEIREALKSELRETNVSGSLILDEVGLCQGEARVDVAVVNGSLHGYEIKSEVDTLARLQKQAHIYSLVLDTVTLVTPQRHLEDSLCLIPDWWGVTSVQAEGSGIAFEVFRKPSQNACIDSLALAQLLWKDETLLLLQMQGVTRGIKHRPRRELWKILTTLISLDELRSAVRDTLKARTNWKAVPR